MISAFRSPYLLMKKTNENKRFKVNFAMAYSGKAEITDSMRKIINKINKTKPIALREFSTFGETGEPFSFSIIISSLLIKFLDFKISQGEISDFDLVIPIPLARKRLLFRGFNQSEVLAKKITQNFSWPLGQNIVSRQNSRQPQVGLRKKDRLANVRGIFKIKYPASEFLPGKKILLVDDVVTTGATLDECAKVLTQAGAKEIWALVLAKG